MKNLIQLGLALALIAVPAMAQEKAAPMGKTEANPVSSHLREVVAENAKNMVAAAEEMPADKYSFQPTPQQMTFAHLVVHATRANFYLCSKISGAAAPESKVAETEGKDKLVAALKSSFDFCTASFAKIDDSNLGDVLPYFGGETISRGGMMMDLDGDYSDHYAMAAMYLRATGLLPPTAKKEK
ncbi:MAG: DinB family protein [Candidatus Acidiferrales bacterium]